jgi:glycosyltransferase involved in cell wall biosynthesis
MKIAFYINWKNLKDYSFQLITNLNPGLPGTAYEFALVASLLAKRNNGIDVTVLSQTCPPDFDGKASCVKDYRDAIKYVIDSSLDYLIVNATDYASDIGFEESNANLIIWAHNDMPDHVLYQMYSDSNVKLVVFCGREMMDVSRDHIVMTKSTYIYNIFPFNSKNEWIENLKINDNHNVVYMGSLIPCKGFAVLAKAWSSVLKKVPDAQLYVIGSGRLYDKDAKLGKYGIADDKFEQEFIPYVTTQSGDIIPSVHFKGLMGEDKYDVISNCKVAVPNPTGCTECLPVTAIEMQLCGCGITTLYHQAYIDTVFNKEFLYKKEKSLADYIVSRMLAPRDNYGEVYEFLYSKFNSETGVKRWEYILRNVDNLNREPKSEYEYHCKSLKDFVFSIRKQYPVFDSFPQIERFIRKINKNF